MKLRPWYLVGLQISRAPSVHGGWAIILVTDRGVHLVYLNGKSVLAFFRRWHGNNAKAGLASKQTKARASDWTRVGDFLQTASEEVVVNYWVYGVGFGV